MKECDLRLVAFNVWSHHSFSYKEEKKKNLKTLNNKSVVGKTQTAGTGQEEKKKKS